MTLLKNKLSARLKEVIAGETIVITDRRKPIASLQSLEHGGTTDKLASLCSRGIVSLPVKSLSVADFFKEPRADSSSGLSALILEEREGR